MCFKSPYFRPGMNIFCSIWRRKIDLFQLVFTFTCLLGPFPLTVMYFVRFPILILPLGHCKQNQITCGESTCMGRGNKFLSTISESRDQKVRHAHQWKKTLKHVHRNSKGPMTLLLVMWYWSPVLIIPPAYEVYRGYIVFCLFCNYVCLFVCLQTFFRQRFLGNYLT